MIRTGSQMSYLGYYGDRRSWQSIGYMPFDDRRGGRAADPDRPPEPPLRTLGVVPRAAHYDAIIVGSGAAGSILAYRFAEPASACCCSSAARTPTRASSPATRSSSTSSSTTRARCSWPPIFGLRCCRACASAAGRRQQRRLPRPAGRGARRWAQRGIGPRRGGGRRGVRVAGRPGDRRAARSAQARCAFAAGVAALGCRPDARVDANLLGTCVGWATATSAAPTGPSTRCSTSCSRRPSARRGSVDVLAEIRGRAVARDGDRAVGARRASAAAALTVGDDRDRRRRRSPRAALLQRCGIGGDAAGQGLHFNINSPLTADFPEPVDTFAGLQMSHAYVPPGRRAGVRARDVVQPAGDAGAGHAGLVRPPLRRTCSATAIWRPPARSSAPRAGPGAGTARSSTSPSPEDLGRVVDGIKLIGRIWLPPARRRVHAGHVRVAGVPLGGGSEGPRPRRPRERRPADDQRASARWQRDRHGGRRGLPGTRLQEPLPV